MCVCFMSSVCFSVVCGVLCVCFLCNVLCVCGNVCVGVCDKWYVCHTCIWFVVCVVALCVEGHV